jgi:Spy/CpxP family protein refolding chaperone
MVRLLSLVILILGLNPAALAQHHQHPGGHSPYAGFEKRSLKAFSEQQLEDLRQGRGMGLALPAELNGYPGPVHVLELADRLDLSPDQKRRMEELHAAMKAESVELGGRLIEQETVLEEQFAQRKITPGSLNDLTSAIGLIQAKLRNAHLKYHLLTVGVLKPDQVRTYNMLRGYAVPR